MPWLQRKLRVHAYPEYAEFPYWQEYSEFTRTLSMQNALIDKNTQSSHLPRVCRMPWLPGILRLHTYPEYTECPDCQENSDFTLTLSNEYAEWCPDCKNTASSHIPWVYRIPWLPGILGVHTYPQYAEYPNCKNTGSWHLPMQSTLITRNTGSSQLPWVYRMPWLPRILGVHTYPEYVKCSDCKEYWKFLLTLSMQNALIARSTVSSRWNYSYS